VSTVGEAPLEADDLEDASPRERNIESGISGMRYPIEIAV